MCSRVCMCSCIERAYMQLHRGSLCAVASTVRMCSCMEGTYMHLHQDRIRLLLSGFSTLLLGGREVGGWVNP